MAEPILTRAVPQRGFDVAQAMRWVRATHGISVTRQMVSMAGMAVRRKLTPRDYLLCGLFSPDMTAAERAAYLSDTEVTRLNIRLNARGMRTQFDLLNDKVLMGFVMERLGLPMPPLKAHVSTHVRLPDPATITTAEGLMAWLRSPGALPAFGKPVAGTLALGAASFIEVTGGGQSVRLGDGREVPIAALAAEIMATYPEGYIFQDLMQHGPEMTALLGPTLAMARVVTVQSAAGPRVLYAVLRIPAAGAMVDATLAGRSMSAWIEPETGRILRVQDMYRMSVSEMEAHPVTGAHMPGFAIPHWHDCVAAVLRGHAGLPDHGILGWDVGVAAHGPVVTEANTNPRSGIFQRASRQGLMNPAMKAMIDEALVWVAGRVAAEKLRTR